MPAYARKQIVREREVATYHCWSKVAEDNFLFGFDPLTQRDFGHRRGWGEGLLEYRAVVFAIDVGGYNILSNHIQSA